MYVFITYLYMKFNTVFFFENTFLPLYFPDWTDHIFSTKFLLYLEVGGEAISSLLWNSQPAFWDVFQPIVKTASVRNGA